MTTRRPLADRFWEKVQQTDDHWLWTGSRDAHGYGRLQRPGGGRLFKAHRVAYELLVGPIPKEMEIDHLCRLPSCVNPAHLEVVTHHENMRRQKWATSPVCRKAGHPWTPENTVITERGTRLCRACRRVREVRRSAERLAARRAARNARALGVTVEQLFPETEEASA